MKLPCCISAPLCGRLIEAGVVFLIIVTPLAFGAVEAWAYTGIELTVALILITLVLYYHCLGNISPSLRPERLSGDLRLGATFLGLFLLGIILQLIPFPLGLIKIISPASFEYLRPNGTGFTSSWHPLSYAPSLTAAGVLKTMATLGIFWTIILYRPLERPKTAFVNVLFWAIIITGFIIAVMGIIQKYSFPDRILGVRKIRFGNPFGPYVNRNHFAGYMEMVIPLGLAVLLARRKQRRRRRFHLTSVVLRQDPRGILLLFMVLVMISALFLSLSRGGIVAFLVSLLYLALLSRRYRLVRKRQLARSALVLLLLVLLLLLYFGWEPLFQRLSTFSGGTILHNRRIPIWGSCGTIIRDHIWLGSGLGTFSLVFPRYQAFLFRYRFTHAENDYIQALTELGLWGGICLFLLMIVYFRAVWKMPASREDRQRRSSNRSSRSFWVPRSGLRAGGAAGVTAMLIHSLWDFNLHIPANALLFSILAAVSLLPDEDA